MVNTKVVRTPEEVDKECEAIKRTLQSKVIKDEGGELEIQWGIPQVFQEREREYLNAIGNLNNMGSCLKCSDTWNWKKNASIKFSKNEAMFPLCEECWNTLMDDERKAHMEELVKLWQKDTPTESQRYERVFKLIRAATHEQLEARDISRVPDAGEQG